MYAESNRQLAACGLSSAANLSPVAGIATRCGDNASDAGRAVRPGSLARILASVSRVLHDWKARRALERLPDEVLADIGLTRADVVRETVQPFWTPLDYDTLETQRRRAAARKVRFSL